MNISVGILEKEIIDFQLNNNYIFENEQREIGGKFTAKIVDKKILFDGKIYNELFFCNKNNSTFTLFDVIIGIDFHWQQSENQIFEGNLKIISDGKKLIAINIIDIEKYLFSVISSEMSATSFLELLKAHAVISRSWLLANIELNCKKQKPQNIAQNIFVKWYERDAHTLFDICADDHCQRYQGVGKILSGRKLFLKRVKSAVETTKGEVLVHNGKICDTRFSKCCGGKTELFSSCWADEDFEYLSPKIDYKTDFDIDLTNENNAEKFILASPKCFCNTNNKKITNQFFNDYDQKTQNFFRWQVQYSNAELNALLKARSGIDFGEIIDLQPVARGASGRITLLKIVGTKRTLSIGKELEIRRILSNSHLYSSAFIVEKCENGDFTLYGAGWGHGVGLCQIGAAVMSAKGYGYREILAHYFKNTEITVNYANNGLKN